MKKTILILIGVLLAALPANAQSADNKTHAERGFNVISAGYDAMFLNSTVYSFNGINLQYVHGFRITKNPLFLESGVSVTYNFTDYVPHIENRVSSGKSTLNSLSVRIPVNISYKFNLGKRFAIRPYTGISIKINPLFQDYQFREINDNFAFTHTITKGIRSNNIFQMGYQIGVGFNISKLYVGIQYGIDFLSRATIYSFNSSYDKEIKREIDGSVTNEDLKSSHLLLSIGYNF